MFVTLSWSILKTHPWMRFGVDCVQWVPVDVLLSLSNPRPSSSTDLGDASGRLFAMDEVWRSLVEEGMRDPLVLSFSRSRLDNGDLPKTMKVRLEAGNHRVRLAKSHGITHLPAVGIGSANAILNKGNGLHVFERDVAPWHSAIVEQGRGLDFFDPYPHPVCVAALLPDVGVLRLSQMKILDEDQGLVFFTRQD